MRAVKLLLLYFAVAWCSSTSDNTKMSRVLRKLEYTEICGKEIERLQEIVKELQDLTSQYTADKERLQPDVKVLTDKLKGKHFDRYFICAFIFLSYGLKHPCYNCKVLSQTLKRPLPEDDKALKNFTNQFTAIKGNMDNDIHILKDKLKIKHILIDTISVPISEFLV